MGSDFMDKMGLGNTGLSEEETKSMEARLRAGEMSFDDFLTQVNVMQKGASLQAMLGKLGGGQQEAAQLEEGQKKLVKYGEFVKVMEPEERGGEATQAIIDEANAARDGKTAAPRLERIAEASGSSIEEVGRFVLEFSMMRSAAVKFANGESPESIRESMMKEQQQTGPPLNRQQRRMAAKKGKKKAKASGGFGRR
jgi:signal recognition particle subunit SRP54